MKSVPDVECPLCGKKMRVVVHAKGIFYVCVGKRCMISINVNDLFVNKWRGEYAIDCPNCRRKMRSFFRSDGYAKCICEARLCKMKIETDEIDGDDNHINPLAYLEEPE